MNKKTTRYNCELPEPEPDADTLILNAATEWLEAAPRTRAEKDAFLCGAQEAYSTLGEWLTVIQILEDVFYTEEAPDDL